MVSGPALRKARKRCNFTQEDVGRLVGVTATAVCQWENEVTTPRKHHFRKLVKIFKTKPARLIAA